MKNGAEFENVSRVLEAVAEHLRSGRVRQDARLIREQIKILSMQTKQLGKIAYGLEAEDYVCRECRRQLGQEHKPDCSRGGAHR